MKKLFLILILIVFPNIILAQHTLNKKVNKEIKIGPPSLSERLTDDNFEDFEKKGNTALINDVRSSKISSEYQLNLTADVALSNLSRLNNSAFNLQQLDYLLQPIAPLIKSK